MIDIFILETIIVYVFFQSVKNGFFNYPFLSYVSNSTMKRITGVKAQEISEKNVMEIYYNFSFNFWAEASYISKRVENSKLFTLLKLLIESISDTVYHRFDLNRIGWNYDIHNFDLILDNMLIYKKTDLSCGNFLSTINKFGAKCYLLGGTSLLLYLLKELIPKVGTENKEKLFNQIFDKFGGDLDIHIYCSDPQLLYELKIHGKMFVFSSSSNMTVYCMGIEGIKTQLCFIETYYRLPELAMNTINLVIDEQVIKILSKYTVVLEEGKNNGLSVINKDSEFNNDIITVASELDFIIYDTYPNGFLSVKLGDINSTWIKLFSNQLYCEQIYCLLEEVSRLMGNRFNKNIAKMNYIMEICHQYNLDRPIIIPDPKDFFILMYKMSSILFRHINGLIKQSINIDDALNKVAYLYQHIMWSRATQCVGNDNNSNLNMICIMLGYNTMRKKYSNFWNKIRHYSGNNKIVTAQVIVLAKVFTKIKYNLLDRFNNKLLITAKALIRSKLPEKYTHIELQQELDYYHGQEFYFYFKGSDISLIKSCASTSGKMKEYLRIN